MSISACCVCLINEEDKRVAELQTITTGLVMGESPRWHHGRLYCFDIATNEVHAIDPGGKRELLAKEPTGVASIGFLDNALLIARRSGLIERQQSDGSFTTYTDLASLSDKPWNDMVVDGRNNLYIGNIGFEFPGGEFRPGLIALVRPDGSALQVADQTAFANGMVVTPDNATLIVAETYAHLLTAFHIEPDGMLSNRRVWAEVPDSFPDGIALDAEGAVWYADVPGKRCVRVAEGGRVLQTIELDRGCFACTLGGADGATLFMLAAQYPPTSFGPNAERTGQVLAAQAPAPKAGWP
jgi:sugar lactone lactonase YvrE